MPSAEELESLALHMNALINSIANALPPPPNNQNQGIPETIREQWGAVDSHLRRAILPHYEPAVQLVYMHDLNLITALAAISTENTNPAQARAFALPLLLRLVQGLHSQVRGELPKQAPAPPAPATPATPAKTRADAQRIESALATDGEAIKSTETRVVRAAWSILAVGSLLAIAAAVVPFVWRPQGSGLTLAVAWSGRLLTVAALAVLAARAWGVHRELLDRAARMREERHRLALLGAVAYFNDDATAAAAVLDIAKGINAAGAAPAAPDTLATLQIPKESLGTILEFVKSLKPRG